MSSAHEVASASLAELRASFDLTQGMVPALGILAHLVGPSGRGWGPAAFAFAIAIGSAVAKLLEVPGAHVVAPGPLALLGTVLNLARRMG